MFYVWYLRGAIFTQVRLLSLHTVNDTWATQQQLERGHFHKSVWYGVFAAWSNVEVKNTWCRRRLATNFISFRHLGDDPGWDLGDLPLRLHRGGLSWVEGSLMGRRVPDGACWQNTCDQGFACTNCDSLLQWQSSCPCEEDVHACPVGNCAFKST